MIKNSDKQRLRDLTKLQLEYANLDIMETRKKMWLNHNDLKGNDVPITMEWWTFAPELNRELKCESAFAREIENNLINQIISYEDIDDDRVIPCYYTVGNSTFFKPYNLDIIREKSSVSDSAAFHDIAQINDLEKDFHKLGKSTFGFNRQIAIDYKKQVEDIIGDIIPIKIKTGTPYIVPTYDIVNLFSMENMIFSMYDYPELYKKTIEMLADDYLEYYKLLESENMLTLNSDESIVAQGTWGFTNELTQKGDKVLLKDSWVHLNSQETVNIDPAMFGEFYFPAFKRLCEPFGLVTYACCEPVHEIWDDYISKIENIRKVSISPWCDEKFMGERLQDRKVIYHRKPTPNFIGVDDVFDEQGFKAHMLDTINAAKGCKLEFSFRDIYSLRGEKGRAKRAVKILRELLADNWY